MVRSLVVLFALVGCPSPDPEPPTDTGTKDRYTPPDTGSPDDARPGDSADSADTGTADPTRLLGGPPLSTAEPTFRQRDHGLNPNFRWLDGSPPLPTNAWWQNLVLGPGTQRVYPLPYQVRADNDGLHVCFPRETATATVVFSSFADDLVLGAVEALGNRAVTAHDLLSVTLTWTSGTRRLITPLVRGAPYVTAE